MNDWQEQWWKQIEKATADVEEFFDEVGEATELLIDEVCENIGSSLERFQSGIIVEIDGLIQDFVDIVATTSDEIDAALSEEWELSDDFTRVSYHTPSAHNHPACINCANYHGQAYNGNLLVCAMHPSGYEEDSCPDWEDNNPRSRI